jgi:hypothetical protein
MQIIRSIQNRIYELRGERVMLDRDLAALYEVETKALNQSVKRQIKRFPSDFMFQLSWEEFEALRSQIVTLEKGNSLRLQNETLKPGRGRHSKYLPFAFTEQGIAMLSGVLNSDKAINMNIAIMRAFVEIRLDGRLGGRLDGRLGLKARLEEQEREEKTGEKAHSIIFAL